MSIHVRQRKVHGNRKVAVQDRCLPCKSPRRTFRRFVVHSLDVVGLRQARSENHYSGAPRLTLRRSQRYRAGAAHRATALPSGSEACRDWMLEGRIADSAKTSVISRAEHQPGHQPFATEQRSPQDDYPQGVLLAPLSRPDDGLRLTNKEQKHGSGARFSTCTLQGRPAPVCLPAVITDATIARQRRRTSGGR